MNILLRELKANFRSMLIWSSIIVIFIAMAIKEFSAYAGNEDMIALLDSFPKQILDAFQFNAFNLTTVSGYFGIMFIYFALILSIHAILLGNSIISKEERDKTVEFILVMPIKRIRLMSYKIIAAFANCLFLLSVTYLTILILTNKYLPEENFLKFLFLSILALLLLQIIFLSTGILLGSIMKSFNRSSYIGISIILIAYFMSLIIDFSQKLKFLKYFTPFKFFDPALMLDKLSLDFKYVMVSIVLAGCFLLISFFSYNKRDLYI